MMRGWTLAGIRRRPGPLIGTVVAAATAAALTVAAVSIAAADTTSPAGRLADASVVVAGDTNLHVTVGHGEDARQTGAPPGFAQILVSGGPPGALGGLTVGHPGLRVTSRGVANAQAEQATAQNAFGSNLILGVVAALAAVSLVTTLARPVRHRHRPGRGRGGRGGDAARGDAGGHRELGAVRLVRPGRRDRRGGGRAHRGRRADPVPGHVPAGARRPGLTGQAWASYHRPPFRSSLLPLAWPGPLSPM